MRAISQIPVAFLYQSYFDSALEHLAILEQPTNEGIVPSTRRVYQGDGHFVAVAAFSDAPVAFRFNGSERDSSVLVCRPGQIIRPGKFRGFDYGLPFGWLGGGHSVIYIGHAEDARVDLGAAKPEVIFHRTRLQIEASAADLPALKRNWPLHFPWTQTRRGVGANIADQRGTPVLRVQPTRTLMRLRSSIAVPKIVGFVFRGTREFDEGSTGTVAVTDADTTFVEVTFSPSTDPTVAPAIFPLATIPTDYLFLAGDEGGLTALNLGDAALTGVEIDIVRFGRL